MSHPHKASNSAGNVAASKASSSSRLATLLASASLPPSFRFASPRPNDSAESVARAKSSWAAETPKSAPRAARTCSATEAKVAAMSVQSLLSTTHGLARFCDAAPSLALIAAFKRATRLVYASAAKDTFPGLGAMPS